MQLPTHLPTLSLLFPSIPFTPFLSLPLGTIVQENVLEKVQPFRIWLTVKKEQHNWLAHIYQDHLSTGHENGEQMCMSQVSSS